MNSKTKLKCVLFVIMTIAVIILLMFVFIIPKMGSVSEYPTSLGKTSTGISQSGMLQIQSSSCYYNNQWWNFPSWVDCDTVTYCGGLLKGCAKNNNLCCINEVDRGCLRSDYNCNTYFTCNGNNRYCKTGQTGLCCEGTSTCCSANTNPGCYGNTPMCCSEGTFVGKDGSCWPEDWQCTKNEHCNNDFMCSNHKCVSRYTSWTITVTDSETQTILSNVDVIMSSVNTYHETTDLYGTITFNNIIKGEYTLSATKDGYLDYSSSTYSIKVNAIGQNSISLLKRECYQDDKTYYTCPDEFQVEKCTCQNGRWSCTTTPELLCIGHGYCTVDIECDDNNPYTLYDKCENNVCIVSEPVECVSDSDCDDDNPYTLYDKCENNVCIVSDPVECVGDSDCDYFEECKSNICVTKYDYKDSDNDGVINKDDVCPDVAGSGSDGCCTIIEKIQNYINMLITTIMNMLG